MSGDFILIGDLVRSVVLLQVTNPRETDPRYFPRCVANLKHIYNPAVLHLRTFAVFGVILKFRAQTMYDTGTVLTSIFTVAYRHRIDADTDPTFHFVDEPEPGPDPDPTPNFTHVGLSEKKIDFFTVVPVYTYLSFSSKSSVP